jgi:hypothetical protein
MRAYSIAKARQQAGEFFIIRGGQSRAMMVSCFVTTDKSPRQGIAFHYLRGKLSYIYYGDRGAPLSQSKIGKPVLANHFPASMKKSALLSRGRESANV